MAGELQSTYSNTGCVPSGCLPATHALVSGRLRGNPHDAGAVGKVSPSQFCCLYQCQQFFPGDNDCIPFSGYLRDGFRKLWMIVQDVDKIAPVQDKKVAEGFRSDCRRSWDRHK